MLTRNAAIEVLKQLDLAAHEADEAGYGSLADRIDDAREAL